MGINKEHNLTQEGLKVFPAYRCHKIVVAAAILAIGVAHPETGEAVAQVLLESGKDQPSAVMDVILSGAFLARHSPFQVGGESGAVLVIYEDGYASISPRGAFESGYSLANEEQALAEGDSVALLSGGGPAMVIGEVDGRNARCYFFIEGDVLERTIPLAALARINQPVGMAPGYAAKENLERPTANQIAANEQKAPPVNEGAALDPSQW